MNITKMNYNDIQDIIKNYLPVKCEEKDKYSEVFTPIKLINELLDKLDNDIWSNPNLKWLEPSSGIGNFNMLIFERLNEGLKHVIKDETERKTHIIKNMLYMVELNEENVKISQNIFGEEANIYCGSFLEDDWKDYFGIEKFDIIVGNPPFNKEKYKRTIKTGTRATIKIWDVFIKKSLENLKYDGYLCFITPQNWRGVSPTYRDLWNIMSNKQIIYLHIYGVKKCKKYFNVNFRFDLFVIKNRENNTETEIIDELGERHYFKLNQLPFLSNYAYDDINKLLVNNEEDGIDIIMSYSKYFVWKKNKSFSQIRTDIYKYPIVHTITKKGIGIWYCNENKGHIGIAKFILNFNSVQYPYQEQNDYEGKYGMSQISFGIPISSKEEGNLILEAIKKPSFKKIIESTKWGAFQTDHRMFKYFKKDWYNFL